MAGILLLASCAQTHENAEQVDHLPNMYPDYADVTIPVNIAPLNFEIRDKTLPTSKPHSRLREQMPTMLPTLLLPPATVRI